MGNPLLPLDEAWQRLIQEVEPLPAEELDLAGAAGRRLAEPLRADRDNPPAPRTAMDGFALRASDLRQLPARLRVVGEVPAGGDGQAEVPSGACVRIFTGANVPPDADVVVPVEQTSSGSFFENPADTEIEIATALPAGTHIIPRGSIVHAGDEVLPAGTRLASRQLAVAASVGATRARVHRVPRVRILNTGRELRAAGQSTGEHETRDSNGPLVEAALREAGVTDIGRRIVADLRAELVEVLRESLAEADVVLLTGGLSAGRYDFVPGAVAELGGQVVFQGVRVKPGKPQLFARMPGGGCVFGLPGNPLSVVTGLYEFALPALRRMAGCPVSHCRPELRLPLGETARNGGGRTLLVPAVLDSSGEQTVVMPRPSAGSADVIRGGGVEGAFSIEAGRAETPAGEIVTFRPWAEWLS